MTSRIAASAGPAGRVRAEAIVDLAAVEHNVSLLLRVARRRNTAVEMMAVVKADGYGHGAVPVAEAARRGGATALGLATPEEAVDLVAGGCESTGDRPVIAWLWVPDQDIRPAVASGVQLVVSSLAQLSAVLAVARVGPGGVPSIHLKLDTGLGRGGATQAEFAGLSTAAAAAQRDGRLRVVGLMSHLASADVPADPSVRDQIAAFRVGCGRAAAVGLTVRWRHLANTPATLAVPDATFDLVRCGIGIYGLDPFETPTPDSAQLRPVMTLRARVALTKRVPAGHGVSYGLAYRTAGETTLALVPLGYADGIPRAAGPTAQLWLAGRRRAIAGRIAMDQFVVDCGDDDVSAGDEVLIFGPGRTGEPTAAEWAVAAGTIGYEIVSRIGSRVPRRYVGARPVADQSS